MEIGRYYLKRGEYLAAMNRFKRVIDNYQTTTHVPEALERLVECDLALGLTRRPRRTRRCSATTTRAAAGIRKPMR